MRNWVLIFLIFHSGFTGFGQTVLDSNHVYNANTDHVIQMFMWSVDTPSVQGVDLHGDVNRLISTLLHEISLTDTLAFIAEYDSTNLFWNIIGHQEGKTVNNVGFVLTYSDDGIYKDFYENAIGGFKPNYKLDCYAPHNWGHSELRWYFVLNCETKKIVYYLNPMTRQRFDARFRPK